MMQLFLLFKSSSEQTFLESVDIEVMQLRVAHTDGALISASQEDQIKD
jgi:hypothetical protein